MEEAEEGMRTQDELRLASIVFKNSSDGIVVTDARAVILSVNPAFTKVTGYSAAEAVGKTLRMLRSGRQSKEFYAKLWHRLLEAGRWQGEIWNRRKSGEIYPEWLTIHAIKNTSGETTHYVGVFDDITEREQLKKELLLTGKIQREMLPPNINSEQVKMKGIYHPLHYVSGDMYGYKWSKERDVLFGYLIDVVGHGVSTALQTSALHVLFRQAADKGFSLKDRLTHINSEAMRFFTEEVFGAAICFEFNFKKRTLTYASAGINHFICLSANGGELMKVPGLFLGIEDRAFYEQHTILFEYGDSFFFFTDGLYDTLPASFLQFIPSYEEAVRMLKEFAYSDQCKDDASAMCFSIL
ncbi:SpoIIE family protein phosphatase [Aneurinibacillus tyrosinisolvens]|uniref:SpoIIE family protein phosphatase n=1 Tax=Aneurinibacillus tyrosinisolvens TaxID=1443435 RepID=UPI00069AFAED|nr:SpoIIE family protein phosphatase [Aneurinibacillus tyrosinisolvens]